MSACAVALAASATLGSPAGSERASFIAYNGEAIAVIRPDGQLVDEVFYTGCPSWSPDGRRFAAADTPVGDERLYVVEVGAGPDHAVARASLYNHGRPSWSPDGKQLVFNVDGGRLLIARADGRGTRVLTKPPIRRTVAVEDWDPAWSPDGKWIAFTRTRSNFSLEGRPGASTPADVYLIRPDGTGLRRLVRGGSAPAWSPDGREIAFARNSSGLWVLAVDEHRLRQVSSKTVLPRLFWLDRRRLFAPEWSPDGAAIAFQAFVRPGRWEIFVVSADGGGERNLTHSPADERSPSWSPDGTSLVYSHTERARKQIYKVDSDGTDRLALTEGGRGGWFDDCPAWAP